MLTSLLGAGYLRYVQHIEHNPERTLDRHVPMFPPTRPPPPAIPIRNGPGCWTGHALNRNSGSVKTSSIHDVPYHYYPGRRMNKTGAWSTAPCYSCWLFVGLLVCLYEVSIAAVNVKRAQGHRGSGIQLPVRMLVELRWPPLVYVYLFTRSLPQPSSASQCPLGKSRRAGTTVTLNQKTGRLPCLPNSWRKKRPKLRDVEELGPS
ncbi:hypothetical protein CH063_11706 [Colletotrichum higginsianum]|uniref:Uncharacterized protein n=1 Tax=Colletotrichum higginsianum (strain IMI 349063) TaxID=759273 RepID=H1VMH8_COLHI|nr:hypothetical protein CH063_11706 [Colletotrichum higginsianum]